MNKKLAEGVLLYKFWRGGIIRWNECTDFLQKKIALSHYYCFI